MGDRETQTQQEPTWWASDADGENLASSPSFDQPLEWPDAMAWESLFEGGPQTEPVYVPDDFDIDLLFPSGDPTRAADGGPATEARLEPLPASIWAPDPADDDSTRAPMATLGGAAAAVDGPLFAPIATAEVDSGRRMAPEWLRRLHVRHGSAAVVALACCVSLVVLGMFLSVRGRDELPTQTAVYEPTGGQIATQAPTTVARPTTTAATTTTVPPEGVSLSDLIPADAAGAGAGATTAPIGTGGTGATTGRTTAPATTAAPSRSAAPSGDGGGSTQQPATTAAPEPEPTAPPSSSPPTTEPTTTPTAAPRVLPTMPDYTVPTFTVPTFPPSSGPGPSGFRNTNN